MVAGQNLVARVYDMKYNLGLGDDDVGGSRPSGTVLHERVDVRIRQNRPTQALLEQGIEDISTFEGMFRNHTLLIANNNEIEITAPTNSPYCGEYFRVTGNPERTSIGAGDSRGYLRVQLKRVEKSRSLQ